MPFVSEMAANRPPCVLADELIATRQQQAHRARLLVLPQWLRTFRHLACFARGLVHRGRRRVEQAQHRLQHLLAQHAPALALTVLLLMCSSALLGRCHFPVLPSRSVPLLSAHDRNLCVYLRWQSEVRHRCEKCLLTRLTSLIFVRLDGLSFQGQREVRPI